MTPSSNRRATDATRILFVRGFNTDNIATGDSYAHVYEVLTQHHDVRYFRYGVDEDITHVYKELCATIDREPWTHLIGHSMGGGLLMRWAFEHYTCDAHKYPRIEKVLLLMPLVHRVSILATTCRIPLVKHALVPKALMLPASKLYANGNLLNDDFTPLPVHQIVGMYHHVMLETSQLVETLNRHYPTMVLLYARGEAFNVIPCDVLQQIHNVQYVDGLHEPFNGLGTSHAFFRTLLHHIAS